MAKKLKKRAPKWCFLPFLATRWPQLQIFLLISVRDGSSPPAARFSFFRIVQVLGVRAHLFPNCPNFAESKFPLS